MKRVYSTLEIKAATKTNGKRIFKGLASTPTPDLAEDVIEPKGAEFKLPMPLLWQHSAWDPIGWVKKAKVTNEGIEVECEIADIPEDGILRDRLMGAWQMIKNKLVCGLSIGFKAIETASIEGTRYGEHIIKWKWLELSAVTIAENQEANITNVKAAFGQKSYSGDSEINRRITKMKTLQEQLVELKETREVKSSRMKEISEAIQAKTATSDDLTEFDVIVEEINQLDDDIRIKTADAVSSKTATAPVSIVKTAPNVQTKSKDKDDDFEGQSFTRIVIAKAAAKLLDVSPIAIAQKRWGKSSPMIVEMIKSAVAGGGTGGSEWGAELVAADARYTGDFINFLKAKTIYDQLPLRPIPANVTIKGQDGTATGYWVGESAAIPASAQSFSTVNLSPLKVGAIAVVSNELLRDSTPAAEQLVRDALVDASAQRVDSTFISAAAAVSGVSPAGVLNGVSPDSASGTDADSLRADIKTLLGDFITAKNASGLHMIMNPALAISIQMLYNALGNPEFPDITQEGGKLLGFPVHTGDNVASDDLIILKPSDIYKIGDMGVQVSISREAMIEMDDAPAMESEGPTGPTGATVGMFQTESTAIKIVRSINFARRRTATSVVGFVGDAAYDNSSS